MPCAMQTVEQFKKLGCACALGAVGFTAHFSAAQPLNLCDYEWKHVTASAAGSEPAGAWNPESGRFMVYGGRMTGWSPETWEFDGQKWIRLDFKTPRQLGSIGGTEIWPRASMAYDERRHKMCLALNYARLGDRAARGEMYEWEGGTWQFKAALPEEFQSNFFYSRIHLIFDSSEGKLLVLNALASGDESFLRPKTGWFFDGSAFEPVAFSPDAYWTLYNQVSADPVRKRVLFAAAWAGEPGFVNETNGSALSAVPPFPLGPAGSFSSSLWDPGDRMWGMSSYYSPLHNGIVQVGGVSGVWYSNQPSVEFPFDNVNRTTAVWNGSEWQVLNENSPTSSGGVACFDLVNSRGLLFGGRASSYELGSPPISHRTGEVWQFSNGIWSGLTKPPPGAWSVPLMSQHDRRTGRMVVAGLVAESGQRLFSQSEWDGVRWHSGATSLSALPFSLEADFRMTWDPAGSRMIAVTQLQNSVTHSTLFRTFAFDGVSWTQIGSDRTDLTYWRIVTNAIEGKVWLVNSGEQPGIFELGGADGNTWVQRSTAAIAINHSGFEAYFDESRNRAVLVERRSTSATISVHEFDGTSWVRASATSPFSLTSNQRNYAKNWNPLLRSVVQLNYQNGRAVSASQPLDAMPLGFPTNSDHRLAKWDGTSWQIINDGGAHPADAGYIWQDQQSGKWFSYGGTPRSDIWELVPLTGERFVRQPTDAIGYAGRNIAASFEFRGGVGGVTYSWRVNGMPITASPTVNGNVVSGWAKPTISITGLKAGTDATLDCLITTGCDSYVTSPIRLFATCRGDLNGDSVVDDADFTLFAECYDMYYPPDDKPLCRLDDSNQVTDDKDFLVFVAAYDAMVCP